MNYLREINAFYDRIEVKPISPSAFVLWHLLMQVNNKLGWEKEFSIPVRVLSTKRGLSERSIRNARNELKTKGYLHFRSRSGRRSAVYQLVSLSANFAGNVSDNASDKISDNTSGFVSGNTSTLNKQNKTKQKKKRQHYGDDSPFLKMAQYLLKQIRAWKPDYVLRGDLQKWADECRKLVELDKRSKVDIKQVVDWATQDAFWQSNILSAKKLREKFDTLQAQMKQKRNHGDSSFSDPRETKRQQAMDMQIAMNRWISAGFDPADQEGFNEWMERGANLDELEYATVD